MSDNYASLLRNIVDSKKRSRLQLMNYVELLLAKISARTKNSGSHGMISLHLSHGIVCANKTADGNFAIAL